MTEKRYQMRNTNLADGTGRIYYNIQRNDGVNICQVYGKNNAKSLIDELNELEKENKELQEELNEFKEYVFSDEKILCYSCVNCISKGIYEVECSEKGKVDVHSSCFLYWKNEVKE